MDRVQAALHSPCTLERFRVASKDFTRRRILPFERVAALILRGHKLSAQTALNKLFRSLDEVDRVPTPSAYSQARLKLKSELFLFLNDLVTDSFYELYEAEGYVRRWKGHRVLGIDGSCLNLPDTPETRAHFSLHTNQSEIGRVQGLASVLYDVLNGIGLSIAIDRKRAEKDFLFEHHVEKTEPEDVIVLDRGYADYAVMAFWAKHERAFVIRMPRAGFREVVGFWESAERERLVDLEMPRSQRSYVERYELPRQVRMRLVKVELATGETEVLATNLLEEAEAGGEELKALYGLRWGVETYLDRIKNIFEVERLSGESVRAIEQDVYGTVFLSTFERVLSTRADRELERRSGERGHRHTQQVNRRVSYSAMIDEAVTILLEPGASAEKALARLQKLFTTNPTPRRAGRRNPRNKRGDTHRLRHYRYNCRVVA